MSPEAQPESSGWRSHLYGTRPKAVLNGYSETPLLTAVLDVSSSPWKGRAMMFRSILAMLSTAAALTACGGGDTTYTSEMESEYMAACVSEATLALTEFDLDANTVNDLVDNYCSCTWAEITSQLAVEEFLAEDEAIANGAEVSSQFDEIINTCGEEAFADL